MSSLKRIIPCLDFLNGRIVKGINFKNLIDIGDPLDVAKYYNDEGADELVFLDISATIENRSQILFYINKISSKLSIPLSVGGGVKNLKDIKNLLNSGADKVSLNSSVINNPSIINSIKLKYGSQCIIIAIDVKKIFLNNLNFSNWSVFKNSGKKNTNLNIYDLVLKFINLGIGEILLTSIDNDGTKSGFDLKVFSKLTCISSVSIIASGGGGSLKNILNLFKLFNINGILLASVLHFKKYKIKFLKNFLFNNGIYFKL